TVFAHAEDDAVRRGNADGRGTTNPQRTDRLPHVGDSSAVAINDFGRQTRLIEQTEEARVIADPLEGARHRRISGVAASARHSSAGGEGLLKDWAGPHTSAQGYPSPFGAKIRLTEFSTSRAAVKRIIEWTCVVLGKLARFVSPTWSF